MLNDKSNKLEILAFLQLYLYFCFILKIAIFIALFGGHSHCSIIYRKVRLILEHLSCKVLFICSILRVLVGLRYQSLKGSHGMTYICRCQLKKSPVFCVVIDGFVRLLTKLCICTVYVLTLYCRIYQHKYQKLSFDIAENSTNVLHDFE